MDRFLPCLARRLPPFALLVLAAMLAAPAQADEGALAYDGNMLAGADLAPDAALRTPPASTGFLQDSEVNEDILLPAAGPQDDDPGHSWPRDYFGVARSEEHTSELQSLMRISYAVFCLKTKKKS